MKIEGITALVTGANRGLGLAYAKALLAAGASKVYAGARDPASVPALPNLVPVKLDVTNQDDIDAAARSCTDVSVVINNAGIAGENTSILSTEGTASLRSQLDTNLYGMLALSQAFAPVLKKNGGGALVNMLSALSWLSLPGSGTYSISKAAAWSLTNALRGELRAQGTLVVGVHAGFIDTDMTKNITAPKVSPEQVAQATIEALGADREEVLADETSRQVKAGFSAPKPLYVTGLPS
jgi:NAD(P)-dependent dehydrogenase (short-subunit alcohol dehydrogenase family)